MVLRRWYDPARFSVARRVICRIASADTDRVSGSLGDGGAKLLKDTGETGPTKNKYNRWTKLLKYTGETGPTIHKQNSGTKLLKDTVPTIHKDNCGAKLKLPF